MRPHKSILAVEILNEVRGSKTHCKRGHPRTPKNTYRSGHGNICKICAAMRCRAYYRRCKEKVAA